MRPESAPKLLTGPEQKMELLEATGVDAVVVVPFNADQAAESPESFVERVLVDCLNTQVIVVGEDFHFGRHRDGNVDLLRKLGVEHDFDVEPIELMPRLDGVDEPVSSTAIRRALAGGDITRANEMLGRPLRGSWQVVSRRPARSAARLPDGQRRGVQRRCACRPTGCTPAGTSDRPAIVHPCAINLGRRPTFYEHADSSLLEAHLLDFDGRSLRRTGPRAVRSLPAQ